MFINSCLSPRLPSQTLKYICYASPNTAVVSDEGYISYMADMHPDWKYLIYDALTDESMKSYYYHDLPTETVVLRIALEGSCASINFLRRT